MLYMKEDFSSAHYCEVDFLQYKIFKLNVPLIVDNNCMPRGIPKDKKDNIIKTLCPMMPVNRLKFWNDIAINDQSADLIDNY